MPRRNTSARRDPGPQPAWRSQRRSSRTRSRQRWRISRSSRRAGRPGARRPRAASRGLLRAIPLVHHFMPTRGLFGCCACSRIALWNPTSSSLLANEKHVRSSFLSIVGARFPTLAAVPCLAHDPALSRLANVSQQPSQAPKRLSTSAPRSGPTTALRKAITSASPTTCPKDKLTEAMVMGTPVVAFCGKVWVPSRDPERFPVCPECREIWESLDSGAGED